MSVVGFPWRDFYLPESSYAVELAFDNHVPHAAVCDESMRLLEGGTHS